MESLFILWESNKIRSELTLQVKIAAESWLDG